MTSTALEDKKAETAIARKYMGKFAVGTLLWAGFVFTAFGTSVYMVLQGSLPLWAGMGINLVLAVMAYGTHHEANHGNIAGYHRRWRFLEPILGNLSLALLGMWGTAYFRWHLAHHGHCNDPRRDPDHVMAGSFGALCAKWAAGELLSLLAPITLMPGIKQATNRSLPPAIKELEASFDKLRISQTVALGLLGVAAATGHFTEAFVLWYVPGKLALLALQITLVWLPHHPHQSTSRYLNTRVLQFPGSFIFQQGHDHHLIHHMFPRVPFYHLGTLFRELQPLLDKHGVVVERGFAAAFAGRPDHPTEQHTATAGA